MTSLFGSFFYAERTKETQEQFWEVLTSYSPISDINYFRHPNGSHPYYWNDDRRRAEKFFVMWNFSPLICGSNNIAVTQKNKSMHYNNFFITKVIIRFHRWNEGFCTKESAIWMSGGNFTFLIDHEKMAIGRDIEKIHFEWVEYLQRVTS